MSGFDNEVVYCNNWDFRGVQPVVAQATAAGDLPIGTGGSPAILVGNITSPGGSITVGYSSPDITIDVAGGGTAVEQVTVDNSTAPGTNPVLPLAGNITITGGQRANASLANVIQTHSHSANAFTVEIQRAAAAAAADVTQNGVAHFDSAAFDVDANGFVQLNGGAVAIQTINGDSGSVAGNTVSFKANTSNGVAGATVTFAASTATEMNLKVTDAFLNTLVGQLSGNALLATPGAANHGFGYSTLHNLTTGTSNTAIGYSSLSSLTTGSQNVGVGHGTLGSGVAITDNTAVGYTANTGVTSGIQNTSVGSQALLTITTGRNNTAIGYQGGRFLSTSDSSNILIGNTGTAGDNNKIIIGTQGSGNGQQNTCFIAGITGVAVSNLNLVTINTSTGQLGSSATSGFGQTITGDSGGALSPTTGNWNIVGLSGSKTSGSGSTLTVKSPPFSQVGTSGTSVANTGEFVTAAVTRTLPVSAGLADGDLFMYVTTTVGALVIQAVGSQTIRIGNQTTSAAGTATSQDIGDVICLRFDATNQVFYGYGIEGNFSLSA